MFVRVFILLGVFTASLFSEAIARQAESTDLFPAHIEVRLGNVGDGFYRVMMDETETPYLPVEKTIFYLLEVTGGCYETQCEAFLPQDATHESPPFLVDFVQSQCYRSTSQPQAIKLLNVEGEWFIHWYSLHACLPIELDWYIDDYRLTIKRHFKSQSDLEEEIQKLRRDSREKAKQLEKLRQQQTVEPLDKIGFSTRVSTTAIYDNENDGTLHLLSDSLLSTENTLSRVSIDSREENPVVYYNLAMNTNDELGTLEVGHVLLDGGLYSKPVSLEHGFYYTNRTKAPEFGTLQLERTTQPNISVDVLINGIYRRTYQSDDFGYFVIEETNITPGDTLTFRYYLAKGVWLEEEIVVAGLEDSFLPQGQWRTELIAKLDGGKVGATNLEYGMGDYFTLGATLLTSEEEKLLGLQARYLPAHWMAWNIGWIQQTRRIPIEIDALLNNRQSLIIEIDKTDNFTTDAAVYDAINYNFSLGRYTSNINFRREKSQYLTSARISTKIANSLFLSAESDYTYHRKNNNKEMRSSLELAKSGFEDTSWNLRGTWDQDGDLEHASASLRNICRDCWLNYWQYFDQITSDLSANYRSNYFDLSASLEARFNSHLRMKLFGSLDTYGMEFTGEFGARSHFDQDVGQWLDWSKYSFAKVTGKVTDQQGQPIENAVLQVLDQYATSNEHGEFVFEQVPARDNLSIYIDEGALDLNLTPKRNPILVNTRQAGITRVSIVLVASFGLDGTIDGPIQPNSYIHFKHIGKGLEYSSSVESDGFFMVEGLLKGAYIITLENGDKKTVMQAYLTSDFWLSNLEYHVDDFH